MRSVAWIAVVLCIAAGIVFAGVKVWQIPSDEEFALFYIVSIGCVPVPIPLGIFTMPKFWGGVLVVLGAVTAVVGTVALAKR